MKEYTTTSAIDASPDAVWAILTNSAGYTEWNPEIVAIDGRMALGERITARVRVGSGAVRTVPMRVTALDAPSRMEWTADCLSDCRRAAHVHRDAEAARCRL